MAGPAAAGPEDRGGTSRRAGPRARPVSDASPDPVSDPGPALAVDRHRWLALVGLALLALAWVGGQPPAAGADEPAHLVKAMGLATGQLAGEPTTGRPPPGDNFLAGYARAYRVPDAYRITSGPPCFTTSTTTSAACLRRGEPSPVSAQDRTGAVLGREPVGRAVSYVAPYPPAPYMLPGLTAQLGGETGARFLLGRLGQAAQCLALVALALRRSTPQERTALALALTPMTLFISTTVNPSGVTVLSAVALAATVLRLRRSWERWDAWGAGAAAALLAVSRPEGPFVAVAVLAVLALFVLPIRFARGPLALAVAGLVAGAAWFLLVVPVLPAREGLRRGTLGPRGVPDLLETLVGRFGWLDVSLPRLLTGGWLLTTGLLVLAALVVASARERLVLLALCAAIPVGLLVLQAGVLGPVGGNVQGRYVLPLAVVVPVAAAAVRERRGLVLPWWAAAAVAIVVAAGHLVAWAVDARRYAVGTDGPLLWWTERSPELWSPPGGWALPVGLAVVGAAVLAWSLCARPGATAAPRPAR